MAVPEPTGGVLYLVGTPIGNLEDLSPRARRVLGAVDLVACEDTRRSGLLLHGLGLRNRLLSFHEHNRLARQPQLLQALAAVVASLLLYLSTLAGAKALHSKTLLRLMHCPMAFFDTTPQGRIINRFSKVRGWW